MSTLIIILLFIMTSLVMLSIIQLHKYFSINNKLKKNIKEGSLDSKEKNIKSIRYNILYIKQSRIYKIGFIYLISSEILLVIYYLLRYLYPSYDTENSGTVLNWFFNCIIENFNDIAESKSFKIIAGAITSVISIPAIISFITYFHNKKMGKKQLYNWRQKICEIEQKDIDKYTFNDLYIINSFINPYTKKNLISYLVNELIYNIYFNRPEVVYECRKQLIKILENGFYNKSYSLKYPSYHSLLELSKKELEYRNFSKNLTLEEALDIKLCCHVLAKLDWEDKS